jgi:KDO2-lipid IV(A) lauroyltransferase
MDKNKTEYFLFKLFENLFSSLKIDKARKASAFLAFVFYYIIPIRKKVVFNNLKIAFPEKEDAWIKKTAYGSYKNFAVTIAEIMCIPKLTREQLHALVDIPNLEVMRKAYERNKGLIMLTAHFGNWELGASSVASQLGVPVCLVAKAQRNPYVTQWLNTMRERFGNRIVMLGMSIRNVYAELKAKNIIGIVGDQRGSREGDRVNFFGRPTAVYSGAEALAVKLGAPVVVAMIPRQPDNTYKVILQEIKTDDLTGTVQEKTVQLCQRYMSMLEEYVRMYPDQWLWMHNRWKY